MVRIAALQIVTTMPGADIRRNFEVVVYLPSHLVRLEYPVFTVYAQ